MRPIAGIFLFISSFLRVDLQHIAYNLFVFLKTLLLFLLGASLLLWTDLSASFFFLQDFFLILLVEATEACVHDARIENPTPKRPLFRRSCVVLSLLALLSTSSVIHEHTEAVVCLPPRSVQHKNPPPYPGRSKEKFVCCCP